MCAFLCLEGEQTTRRKDLAGNRKGAGKIVYIQNEAKNRNKLEKMPVLN